MRLMRHHPRFALRASLALLLGSGLCAFAAGAAFAGQKESADALHRLIIDKVDNAIATSGEIKGQRTDYSGRKSPKALVVCMNWREVSATRYVGGGYIRTGSSANPPKSVDAAIAQAMNNCKQTCKATCVLADRDGQNALQPPADWQ